MLACKGAGLSLGPNVAVVLSLRANPLQGLGKKPSHLEEPAGKEAATQGCSSETSLFEGQGREEVTGSHTRESAGHDLDHCCISWSGCDWEQRSASCTDFFGVILSRSLLTCCVILTRRSSISQSFSGSVVRSPDGENLFRVEMHGHQSWKSVHPPRSSHHQEKQCFCERLSCRSGECSELGVTNHPF